MSNKPPKINIPGLNRGAGVPAGYILGRRRGTGQGPAQLLDLNQIQALGVATTPYTAQGISSAESTAASSTGSLSTSVSTQISSVVSTNVTQSTSLSQISSSLSGAISTNVGQSTSLSQISSSLSGAISSTTSLSTAVSTVISGSVSTLNSRIDSLSAAGGGGGVAVQDEGVPVVAATTLNFVGGGVSAADAGGGVATVTIPGGDVGQSTSLSQISSSLSGAISSTSSLSTAVSTVISASISAVNSSITSLSTALAFSGALIHKSADETAADYSANGFVPWDSEASGYDTDGYHPLAATVTITIATPGVVTWTGHNFILGSPVVFTTTGALPTGLTAGTTYYVLNPAANTFQVSATRGGAAVNTSGSQSGVHTGTNYSRLTIATNGKYRFGAQISIAAGTVPASEYNRCFIAKNGSATWLGGGATITEVSVATGIQMTIISAVVDCVAGDYFEIILDTETDTSITVSSSTSWFSVERRNT